MAVIVVDLDHLKQVNDPLGHDSGNQLQGKPPRGYWNACAPATASGASGAMNSP